MRKAETVAAAGKSAWERATRAELTTTLDREEPPLYRAAHPSGDVMIGRSEEEAVREVLGYMWSRRRSEPRRGDRARHRARRCVPDITDVDVIERPYTAAADDPASATEPGFDGCRCHVCNTLRTALAANIDADADRRIATPLLLTFGEAAQLLGVSEDTARGLV